MLQTTARTLLASRRSVLANSRTRRLTLAAAVLVAAGLTNTATALELVTGKPSEGLVFSVQNGDAEQGLNLWRARISDGALQRISITDEFDERWPRWSPQAGEIAFLQRNLDGMMKSQIMLLDPKTGERRNVRANPDLVQRSHAWSPDGKYIAHTFRVPPTSAKEKTNAGTVLVDLAAGERQIISESEEIGYRMQSLAFSNDGKMVVAHGRSPKDSSDDKLWLLRAGQKPKEIHGIPRGIYDSPTFTPDDKAVLFDYQQVRGHPRDIMRVVLEPGERAKRIASSPRADENTAVVSPKRNEMLMLTNHVGIQNLMLVDLASGKQKILSKDLERVATTPVWSPDGERIAYVSIPTKLHEKSIREFDKYRVHVIDREGKSLFTTTGTMPSFMPAWQGDQPIAPYAKKAVAEKPNPAP